MEYLLIFIGLGLVGFGVYYLKRGSHKKGSLVAKGTVSRMNDKLATRQNQSLTSLDADQKLDLKVQGIWDKHNPEMGNVVAWWRGRKLGGQNRFLETANEQQRLLIDQASMMAEALAKRQISEEEFRVFVMRNSADLHILGKAAQVGMTVQDYSETNKARHLAQIEIEKELRRQEISLHARKTEYDQNQENIDRAVMSPAMLEEHERQQLYRMYDERETIKKSNDPAKEHKLRAIDLSIKKKEEKLFGG